MDLNEHLLKVLKELQSLVLERDKKEVEEAKKFLEKCKEDKKDLIQTFQKFLFCFICPWINRSESN